MKKLFTIILTLTAVATFAQQVDSLEIKLRQYKDLYEKGLIGRDDYENLKDKALSIKVARINTPKLDSLHMAGLKGNYTSKFYSGAVCGIIGDGLIVYAFVKRYEPITEVYGSKAYDDRLALQKKNGLIFGVAGGVANLLGFILSMSAIHNMNVYHSALFPS